jgi:spermidine/putrescine transport system permease protein
MADRLIKLGFRAYIVLGFLFIFAPILSLIVFAFNDNRFPSLPWSGFSTRWFDAVFATPEFTSSLRNSLVVGAISALIATFLGGTAAYLLNRWDFRGKGIYLGIAVLPPCIPLIILGLALLIYLKEIGLSGSLTSVVISHVVLGSAFALGIVRMRLTEMDAALEEAAWNLGASQWRAIREVVLPQAAPAILAAFLITMAVSWDEFIISWFVSGLDVTLPVAIFNELQGQVSARINAIGTIVFGVTITLVVLAQLILFVWGRTGSRRTGLGDEEPVVEGAAEVADAERAVVRGV